MHCGMKASVDVEGNLTDEFEVKNGVRQGCCLASLLFGIYASVWSAKWVNDTPQSVEYVYKIDGKLYRHANAEATDVVKIRDGFYVDDAVAISTSAPTQTRVAKSYQRVVGEWGGEMNIKKTKSLVVGGAHHKIHADGGDIESVSQFTYLGSIFNNTCTMDDEINERLSKAKAAFARLWRTVWGVRQLSTRTKIKVYKACVLSVLLYGSETWPISRPLIKRLERFHMGNLRWILNINRRDQESRHIRNVDMLRMTALTASKKC